MLEHVSSCIMYT